MLEINPTTIITSVIAEITHISLLVKSIISLKFSQKYKKKLKYQNHGR